MFTCRIAFVDWFKFGFDFYRRKDSADTTKELRNHVRVMHWTLNVLSDASFATT